MLRAAVVCVALVLGVSACGAGASLGKINTPLSQTSAKSAANKKDCAACEKMCKVAGDSEKNKGGVDDCVKDCKKDCS
jgi:hypothetical protein